MTPRSTLRRRLVVVLVGLLAVVAAAMGAVSTVALHTSLVDQLDDRLAESALRSVIAQDRPTRSWSGDEDAGADADDDGDEDGNGGDRDRDGGRRGGPPPGLDAPGQGAGTVAAVLGDDATTAGRYDERGDYRPLTDAQVAVLGTVPADGRPHTVTLDGLGEYRVLSTTRPTGTVVVTGLSTDDAATTVQRYLVAEAVIALAGLGLAGLAAGALVRRELRPLERVAATAARVSELPLHEGEVALVERVPDVDTDPSTEVGQVGAALNRLLGHVEAALGARHRSETQVRQFVADASHELRTPLASIRGYAELVRRLPADLPDDARRAMERVESESRRMTALVEDMLLLARLDAGRPLDRAEVDLAVLTVDALADAHAAGPDHHWRLDLPDPDDAADAADAADAPVGLSGGAGESPDPADTRALVLGDEDRLRQVLVNLLANARVHTPPGTTVVASVRTDGTTVTLRVRDDGPGIPADLGSRLFRRFTRGDAARSPGSGSTGLGLAIVDAVVQAHGGRVEVDGTPGATTFTVTLPAARPVAPVPAPA